MFDLYIDPTTGDLAYQNGGLSLVRDTNKRVRQELEVTLRAFKGEWFNNTQFGGINRDYIAQPGITKLEVDAWYRRTILSNPEVLELVFFESRYNRNSRQYDLEFVVRTLGGTERGRVALTPTQEVVYTLPPQEEYLPPITPSIKSMAAFIAGTSGISAILTKDAISFVPAPIAGVSSVTATAVRTFQSVTITGSGALSAGNGVKAMSATITASGAIAANMSTVMSAAISASGALTATVYKPVSSTITGTGVLTASVSKQMSSTISGTSAVTAAPAFGGGTVISGTSNVTAAIAKNMVATIAGTSLVSAGPAYALSATLTGTTTTSGVLNKRLVSTIAGIGAITGSINKSSGLVMVGTSNVVASITKQFSANITSVHSVVASINKGSNTTIAGTSTVSANLVKVKYTSSAISGLGSITANFTKVKQMSATIVGSSTTTASGLRTFVSSSIGGSGALSGTMLKRLIANVAGTGVLTGSAAKGLSSTIAGTSATAGSIGKVKPMVATILNGSGTTANMFPGGLYDLEAMKASRIPQTLYPMNDYSTADIREYVNPLANLATYGSVALVGQQGMIRDGSRTASVKANSLNSIEPVVFLSPSDVLPVAPATGSGKLGISFWTSLPATLTDASLMAGYNFDGGTNWVYWDLRITSAGAILFRLYNYNTHDNGAYIQWSSGNGVLAAGWNTFIAVSLDTNQINTTNKCQIYTGNWPGTISNRVSAIQTFGGYFQSLSPGNSDYDSIQVGRNYTGAFEKISTYNSTISETNARLLFNTGNRTLHDNYIFESNPSSYIRFELEQDYAYQSDISLTAGFRLSYNGNGSFSGTDLTRGSIGGTSGFNSSPRTNFTATNGRQRAFSVWVRPTAFAPSAFPVPVMGLSDNDNGISAGRTGLTLAMSNTGVLSLVTEGTSGSFSENYGNNALSLNTTYHVTAIVDLDAVNTLRLFINGVECVSTVSTTDGSWSAAENIPTGSQYVFYGADSMLVPSVTVLFSGTIERAATFESVLSDAKIISLYDSGKI